MSFVSPRRALVLVCALFALQSLATDAEAARKKSGARQVKATAKAAKHAHAAKPLRKVSLRADEAWPGGRPGLSSASVLVLDQRSGDTVFEKNSTAVVPIASITKLMTAMVALDAAPGLRDPITIAEDDVDMLRGSRSRLPVGTVLAREDALLLALMASENRAAHALARHYPGGTPAFVAAMNRKAASLGMHHTRFEDPTGLSSNNVASARDLARMVQAAHAYPLIREFSTTSDATIPVGARVVGFRNTNALVKSERWEIGLSKTGFIHEAGKCLVMQARLSGRPVVMVLLDSAGKLTRIGDANRIKRWMESGTLAQRAARTA
jgi:D-alanyl-D-alanine endopeptidase (penicillin-binding protein 7)